MPEGHTLHRLARQQQRDLAGGVVAASSPQGRFADGAAVLDGHRLVTVEAYGKHLFQRWDGVECALHVHLGPYGKCPTGRLGPDRPAPPEPRGALRLRLVNDGHWADLRGPIACELLAPDQVDGLLARLGPDPLAPRPDPGPAWARIARSRKPVAALLMDQAVLAGVGNVYRAELLFRARLDPFTPGRALPRETFDALWADLVPLMKAGVRSGRIVTVRPEDRARKGRLTREQSVYVYRRAGLPCRVCGTAIRTEELAGRNLFWCPGCQRPG